ncbi:MAG TPA: hypothetical protein VLM85_26915, partial [Polyangiaceae bacterium]|nr:hypothetical protein [Polyangiaceae bacterium]
MTTREPRERARWRVRWWGKWSRRALKGAGSLVALVLGLALIVVHNLDRPWVKRRVQAIVAKSAGVEIDYGAVRVSLFSGLDIDDIVVLSPPEVRRAAPELARIGHVAARWSLGSLAGDGPEITKLTVADVAVTVAMDEKGRTSFDAIPTTKPPEPSVPLSHRGASLLGSALPVGEIDITNVSATLVSTKEGNEVERTNLGGVELSASAEPAGQGGSLRLRLGSEGAPLELDLRRHGPRGDSIAHARFSATAVATSTDLALAIDLRVVDQTFAAGYGVAHVLHAGARARFDAPVGRTDVTLAAELADGAGHAEEAFASIPDEGAPILHHAVGEIDLARLLTAVPAELVPVTVTHAQVRYRVVEALLENPPRVSDRGTLAIDGDLSNLKLRLDGGGALSVDTAAVGLHVMPDSASAIVHGSAAFDGVTLASSRGDTKASAVDVRVDGRQSPGGALDGTVKLGFASVEASGSSPFAVRDGNLTVALGDLHVDADNPLATKGDVTITGEIAEISARSKSSRSVAGTVALRAHALLSGHAPYAVEVEAKTARLQLFDDKGRPLADAPARVAVAVTNAAPDLARPIASTGKAHLEAELGDARLDLDAGKEVDAVDYELHAHAATLEPTRPLLPADDTALIPLGRMALAIESKGRVERISSALPEIRHHTKLDIDRPGFGSIAARSLAVTVDSHGTAMRHDADIDVRAQALAIAGLGESDDHVTLSAKIDRAVPALRIELGTDGRATSKLAVAASFDRSRRAVSYEVSGELSHLASLQPLVAEVRGLDGLDLSKLEVGVAAKGELFGVVEDVTSDGATRMASNLALTAAATGTIDVRLAHASYGRGDVAVAVPQLTWHADLGLAGAQRKLQSHLDVASVHLAVGGHVLDAANISDQLSGIVTGDLHNPDA